MATALQERGSQPISSHMHCGRLWCPVRRLGYVMVGLHPATPSTILRLCNRLSPQLHTPPTFAPQVPLSHSLSLSLSLSPSLYLSLSSTTGWRRHELPAPHRPSMLNCLMARGGISIGREGRGGKRVKCRGRLEHEGDKEKKSIIRYCNPIRFNGFTLTV